MPKYMVIAFVPVLHRGYLDFFYAYRGETLGILGPDIIQQFSSLARDCRTLPPETMQSLVENLDIFSQVRVLCTADLQLLSSQKTSVVFPDEDISHLLAERYFPGRATFVSVFLRWHKMPTMQEHAIPPDRIISQDAFVQEVMQQAIDESQKSADWWRQVGAVFVKDGKIIARGHNHHLPSDIDLAFHGDPRTNFDAGVRIDLSTAIHAEASVIATCAKQGISLMGSSVFVSTFPCPGCARLLVEAGIQKVYYYQGYSLLDAERIFRAYGQEIMLVTLPDTRQ